MTPIVEGNMDAEEHVSSLVRISTMLLQDGKDAAKENPTFEEQLHELDKEINYSPVFSKLHLDFSELPSVPAPLFSHATLAVNVSKANLDLIRNEVRHEMDSLEAIQAEEFKVG